MMDAARRAYVVVCLCTLVAPALLRAQEPAPHAQEEHAQEEHAQEEHAAELPTTVIQAGPVTPPVQADPSPSALPSSSPQPIDCRLLDLSSGTRPRNEGRFEAAIDAFLALERARPDCEMIRFERAVALSFAHRFEESLPILEALQRQRPNDIGLLAFYARSARWSGDLALADELYQRLLPMSRPGCEALTGLAFVASDGAEWALAQERFVHAIDVCGETEELRSGLERVRALRHNRITLVVGAYDYPATGRFHPRLGLDFSSEIDGHFRVNASYLFDGPGTASTTAAPVTTDRHEWNAAVEYNTRSGLQLAFGARPSLMDIFFLPLTIEANWKALTWLTLWGTGRLGMTNRTQVGGTVGLGIVVNPGTYWLMLQGFHTRDWTGYSTSAVVQGGFEIGMWDVRANAGVVFLPSGYLVPVGAGLGYRPNQAFRMQLVLDAILGSFQRVGVMLATDVYF